MDQPGLENLDKRLRHDMRGHLQCINIGCDSLMAMKMAPEAIQIIKSIQGTVDVINNLLDLTRQTGDDKGKHLETT